MSTMLILLMMGAALAQNKITKDELVKVITENRLELDRKESFRCGLFFPDPKDPDPTNPKLLPVGALLLFNSSWPATECPSGDISKYNQFCDSIMKPFSARLTLKDPSLFQENALKGWSIGDDICWVLNHKVKAPYVGPPKSKKFPEGVQFGMYSNSCGQPNWIATGLIHREKVCCQDGKYDKC
eukprot:TRINITY_DN3812_c0_g1_i1.p1 TRINITY_DN3812_c0_g1~~TRINITY_DN3812_c0_g1_i1.p1  ORF type:complete len:194 (+),score=45.99 TRINITY_DN3812_c0_g1_i1:31-582(+)